MIKSSAGKFAEKVWTGAVGKGFPANLVRSSQRKLVMIDNAAILDDLRVPPSNHLEALKGDRAGQHSIRINDQWCICFVWKEDGAHDVEIEDYH